MYRSACVVLLFCFSPQLIGSQARLHALTLFYSFFDFWLARGGLHMQVWEKSTYFEFNSQSFWDCLLADQFSKILLSVLFRVTYQQDPHLHQILIEAIPRAGLKNLSFL